ncbi:MAG TPA: hypothetical protein VFQ58_05580 [Flavisolibacter sp.]|nr:hypothetical protein [Flavisolibacter sp.]
MPANHQISYLSNKDINRQLWNKCIESSPNGLIYGYSFYLDYMADNWDALILNNYEAVMPLPWRRKSGIHYIYQPFLVAQLGIFGDKINNTLTEMFLSHIPLKFKYIDLPLNSGNGLHLMASSFYQRSNYVLNLNNTYSSLYNAYRENIKRNIKKAKNYGCRLTKDIDVNSIISLAKDQSDKIEDSDFSKFRELYYYLSNNASALTFGIVSGRNELLASCVFFYSHKRAYYILVGNHPNGRTLGASHLLIDSFIQENAEKDMILDFEGSDIRNLAFFYSSFGSIEEKYLAMKWNRLPWYMKWLKG